MNTKEMKERKRQLIWDGGPVGEILELSRQIYHRTVVDDPTAAHVERASDFISLAGRFRSGRQKLTGARYVRRATRDVRTALDFGLKDYDQVDVCSNILSKAPWILGGRLKLADKLVGDALSYSAPSESSEMLAHTRGLLLCTRADIKWRLGEYGVVESYYDEALALKGDILQESDKAMAERQWVRIAFAAGSWLFDCGDRAKGTRYVSEAYGLARRVSRDQLEKKIIPWMRQHDMAA